MKILVCSTLLHPSLPLLSCLPSLAHLLIAFLTLSTEIIQGIDPSTLTDLGQAVRRDPDALPPRNALESVMNWMYRAALGIGGGNALFAIKAGLLTGE